MGKFSLLLKMENYSKENCNLSYFLFNTPTERSSKKNLVLKEKFGFSKKNLE